MSSTDPEVLARLLRSRAAAGPLRIEVSGGSMGRTIVTGSTVWIVARRRPRWGEVWAFGEPGGNVAVHRCVWSRRGHTRFWGDGNPAPDPPAPDTRLIGKVIRVEAPDGSTSGLGPADRYGRSALLWLRRLPRRARGRVRSLLGRRY
jgi:hypothetical protein